MKVSSLKTAIAAVVVGGAIALGAAPAVAGGFLADVFVRPFSPSTADKLDEVHKQLGNPLDHAANGVAGAAANAIVPGSGPAVTTVLEANTEANRKK